MQALQAAPPPDSDTIQCVWMLLCGVLVMMMQTGFALLETGLSRAKNAAHTMSMNLLVFALGVTAFFISGHALMGNGTTSKMLELGGWNVLGNNGFFLSNFSYEPLATCGLLLTILCMNVAATIPTGSCAERWSFKSFFIFTLLITGLICPIFGGWVWSGGWLAQLGVKAGLGNGAVDFAGSSVIHLQGGVIALTLAWLLGPRIGKYDPSGRPRPILGHSVPLVMLGTFLLTFGWFGFTAGRALAAHDGHVGLVAINTIVAAAGSLLASCLYMWLVIGKPDPSMMCNGLLAGLVAICAPCAFVHPFAAFCIGAAAGVIVVWSVFFWEKIGIDDPVGAISVHAVSGLWGLIALGLFADGSYGLGFNGTHLFKLADGSLKYFTDLSAVPSNATEQGVTGLFYGNGTQIVAELIAAVVCIAWCAITAGVLFTIMGKIFGSNRVPPEVEIAGLDIPEMGAPGYPEFMDHMAPEQVPTSEILAARAGLFTR